MIKTYIIWLDEFKKRIDPARFKQIENRAIKIWAEVLKWKIQENTPVDTWLLRNSYKTEPIFQWVRIYNTKKYGLFIHEGTKPHRTSVKNLSAWAKRHWVNPYALQKAIARKWVKGRKWIDKTLSTQADKVKKAILNFIKKNV